MIQSISSSDSRFKQLKFGSGLNVILADRTETSSEHDSRNGSGKSSLIRLFHFLLGSNTGPKSFFRKPELSTHSFVMCLDLAEDQVTVVRSGSDSNSHYLNLQPLRLSTDHFLLQGGDISLSPEWKKISLMQWKDRLSQVFFNLQPELPPYSPSTRSLISYLVRRKESGGFTEPFKHSNIQQPWDTQVSLSFLLDLDWSIPAEFEQIRGEQKSINDLKKAASSGTINLGIGSAAELRTELAVARERAERLRARAGQFTVVDHYAKFQEEADQITQLLRELRDQDELDNGMIEDLEAAAINETLPGSVDLERLWDQVNLILPDHVLTAYDDVKVFHESVITNRKMYLEREVELAKERISERQAQRAELDSRRSQLMQLLSSGGALDEFVALESEAARAEGEVRELERHYEIAEKFENTKAQTGRRRQELLVQLRGDHNDRADRLSHAIVLFEQYSRKLYNQRRGSLIVRETLKGPEFDVDIAGKGSVGIDSMQILCFDFTLMTLLSERKTGPGFLIHDSHIFDGVDERQVASALMLGAELADKLKFQYIVTLNSDSIPDFPSSFDFYSHVNPVKLTDATEDGGLFGFRFD